MSDVWDSLKSAARWYCEHGFGIIPIKSRSKEPATRHGLADWFDDPRSAEALWGRDPEYNVAMVCGAASHGVLVIDIDGEEGYQTWRAWEKAHGELPPTATAVTGSGGLHLFYKTDRTQIHPSVNAELKVDIRAEGSYAVLPPSVHPNGRRYEWQDPPDETPIATADSNVYDFIDYVQRNGGSGDEITQKPNGKFRLPDKIGKGARDNTLFRYASHLRAIGRSDEEILTSVMGANALRCDPPLDSRDVERIARSACRYERGGDEQEVDARPIERIDWRTPKGKIIHNKLGDLIKRDHHACLIGGAPAAWIGGAWDMGVDAFERAVIMHAPDSKIADQREVTHYVMRTCPSVDPANGFEQVPYVRFRGCVVNGLTGEVVDPRPDMLILGALSVDYNPDAYSEAVDGFITSVSDGDGPTAAALLQVVARCMTPLRLTSESPMLVGVSDVAGGEASNGKSTFLNMLRSLLGPSNVSSLDIATLGQRFQQGRIVGKLANIGDDVPNGFLKGDELSIFKKCVTGDTLYTDVKNGTGFEFVPMAAMVFSMNSMPRLADATDGVMRRIKLIPFRRRFSPDDPDFDPDILTKLTTTASLQYLALLGLSEIANLFETHRFVDIPDMTERMDAIRADNDGVLRWIEDESVTADSLVGRPIANVYSEYVSWAKDSGEGFPVSRSKFTRRVGTLVTLSNGKRLESKPVRAGKDSKRVRVFSA